MICFQHTMAAAFSAVTFKYISVLYSFAPAGPEAGPAPGLKAEFDEKLRSFRTVGSRFKFLFLPFKIGTKARKLFKGIPYPMLAPCKGKHEKLSSSFIKLSQRI